MTPVRRLTLDHSMPLECKGFLLMFVASCVRTSSRIPTSFFGSWVLQRFFLSIFVSHDTAFPCFAHVPPGCVFLAPPPHPPQSFRSKRLDDGETKCINVCAEKFIKLTSRVALRFQDIQQQKAKDEAAAAPR